MATTYEPIATTTFTSSQASVDFNSIPGTYTDLVIVASALAHYTSSTYVELRMRFNSDSATNYSFTEIRGNGTTAGSSRASTQTYIKGFFMGAESTDNNSRNNLIINLPNYSNTTTYKTALIRNNSGSWVTGATVGLWRKTPEAITSVSISNDNSATGFLAGTFTLYGIKAA